MSGLFKRLLSNPIATVFETAQSVGTGDSQLLLQGPVDVYGIFMHSGQNTNVFVFDTDHDQPLLHMGQLPDGESHRVFCPSRAHFSSGVHIGFTSPPLNPSITYTIFYKRA